MRSFLRIKVILISLLLFFLTWCQAQNGQIFTNEEIILTAKDCQANTLVCLAGIQPSTIATFAFTLDNNPYPGLFPSCKKDTLGIYSYEFLFGKGNAGPYRLDSWVVNGQTFTGIFQNIPDLIDSMNTWDPSGNWQNVPTNFQIQGGGSASTYSQMKVTVLSISTPGVIGYNVSYTTIALGIPVQTGVHQLVALDLTTGDLDTLMIIVGCSAQSEEHIQTEIGKTGNQCLDLSSLISPVTSIINQCPAVDYPASAVQWDPLTGCFSWTGTAVGTDTLCLMVCDSFGFCSRTTYFIEVLYPGALTAISLSLYEGDTLVFCPDLSGLPGTPVTLLNICPEGSGQQSLVALKPNEFCVPIIGLMNGLPEYACLVACDDQGECDTITVEIRVLSRDTSSLEVYALLNMEEEFCPDITGLPGTILSISDLCPDHDLIDVVLDPVTMCVRFSGTQPGQDTICLLIQDEWGNQQLTLLHVYIQTPTASTDSIEVILGQSVWYCPALSELAGDLVSMTDDCSQFSNGTYSLDIDLNQNCIEISGLLEGEGHACLILCDDLQVCDTVFLGINVLKVVLDPAPQAVHDAVSTYRNEAVNISVLLNDLWGSSGIEVTLVASSGPLMGQALVEPNGSVTYIPNPDECGEDQFMYSLCNATGCDTALVSLEIYCADKPLLEPFTGFSPNGDGINEYFAIKGIESFPRNTLEVYNRWGNRIFIKTDYQGDWDGTWGGLVLPDGTYYYILQTKGLPALSGYVYLHR
ncbi:MAG: gliding motility-associated C-terminal domain-containing protein [Saprospiraceae bacterium]|nr:gliding motility-associated C-terminal domain-containing protein [Saprospiraceae bacterium]